MKSEDKEKVKNTCVMEKKRGKYIYIYIYINNAWMKEKEIRKKFKKYYYNIFIINLKLWIITS